MHYLHTIFKVLFTHSFYPLYVPGCLWCPYINQMYATVLSVADLEELSDLSQDVNTLLFKESAAKMLLWLSVVILYGVNDPST